MIAFCQNCNACIRDEKACLYRTRFKKIVKEDMKILKDRPNFVEYVIRCAKFEQDELKPRDNLGL